MTQENKKCSCGEPHISQKTIHRYDGLPCYVEEKESPFNLESIMREFDEEWTSLKLTSMGDKIKSFFTQKIETLLEQKRMAWYDAGYEDGIEDVSRGKKAFLKTERTRLIEELIKKLPLKGQANYIINTYEDGWNECLQKVKEAIKKLK